MSKEQYLEVAGKAAELERTKEFKPASELWQVAQSLAVNSVNKDWCKNRAEKCDMMSKR